MTDCLILGFSDSDFEGYVEMVRGMGADSGGYRDLNLAFIDYDGKPQRSLDLLTTFYYEDKPGKTKVFHNADFLWPVVTYLGTYLHRRGFSFDYVNLPHIEKDKLRDKLLNDDILTIAITTTLYVSMHPILDLVSFIKQYNDKAKIIVGGPYIANQPKTGDMISFQRLLRYIGADIYVISSEGEAALVNIIQALKANASLDKIDNIAYKDGGKYVLTATSIESNPLEENMVDYTLFPKEEIDQFVTTRTAKSCPFSCSFCGFPQRAGKYKYLDVALVEKELDAIREIGNVTTITFLDDTFNVPKERFKEILRMMIKNNYGYKWNSFYRSDHGDDETIELMGKAGCEGVFLGVESGSDAMLKTMNKTARQKDYRRAIPLLRDAGITTHANIIVGFPGETFETVQESIDLIEQAKPDFYRAQLWYADPVTPIWNKKDEYGVTGSMFNWAHTTMDCYMASDLVEKMFLCVENSVWLPQNGFEQWSTFYLQRRGMSLEQLKTFMKCFNALIKEKLIYPDKKEIDPKLLESFKDSCRFDQATGPDMRPIELISGSKYVAAEQFWVNEFRSAAPSSNLEAMRTQVKGGESEWASLPVEVEKLATLRAQRGCNASLSEIALAIYGSLLSRLNDREELIIVADMGEAGRDAVPLRMYPSWGMSFKEFVQQIQRKIEQVKEHQIYGLHILTNPRRLQEKHAAAPAFEIGFLYRESEDATTGVGLEEALKLYQPLSQSMGLLMKVNNKPEAIEFDISYKKGWLNQETVEKLGPYLLSILDEVGRNPDVPIDEIVVGSKRSSDNSTVDALVTEAFNF